MVLFLKKKTPDKILAEGRSQFKSGNLNRAFSTVQELADKGEPEACYYVGVYWLKKDDKCTAEKYLATAAGGGWQEAARLLNQLIEAQYDEGIAAYDAGDHAKALSLFEKAAEHGHAYAQFNCGHMYYTGKGTELDDTRALYWFEKAAEQGDAQAQFRCGYMYYIDSGTDRNMAKATSWLKKAAGQTEDKETQEEAMKLLMEFY